MFSWILIRGLATKVFSQVMASLTHIEVEGCCKSLQNLS